MERFLEKKNILGRVFVKIYKNSTFFYKFLYPLYLPPFNFLCFLYLLLYCFPTLLSLRPP